MLAAFLADLEFHLSAERVDDRWKVANAGDRLGLAGERGASQRGRRDGFRAGHRKTRRYSGALIDGTGFPNKPGEARDDFEKVQRYGGDQVSLLDDEVDFVAQSKRVMGANLRAEAVLERCNDATAVGVIFGIRAGDEKNVQRQPEGIPAYLDVSLFENIEQSDLDPLGEIGQFIDGENAAVEPRHQTVVHGFRVTERASFGDLDGIDVADEVADTGVRCRQFLAVPLVAVLPDNRQLVAGGCHESETSGTDGPKRMVIDLAAGDNRRPFVQ